MTLDISKGVWEAGNPAKRGKRRTLLFVDYTVPQYDLYAGSRTNLMYLELLLEMDLEIKFLPADFCRIEPYSSELNQMGIETLDGEWYEENWEDWLKANGQAIDFVFFHKPDPAIMFLPAVVNYTDAAVIYQCHDLKYLRLQREAEIENDEAIRDQARQYELLENDIFNHSDVLLTFSAVEENFIRQKFPNKPIFTVPLFFYPETEQPDRDFSKRHDLLFVGACAHTPNSDAITWFCREILPLVHEQLPDVVFKVVSADPPEEVSSLDSDKIRILGRVSEEKLGNLYERARLMVVPLRFGAGVKGKVIESLYKGLPVVSTGIGLEGIKGVSALATAQDTAEDFARELVALYSNEKRLSELSELGKNFIAGNFTADSAEDLMAEVLSVAREDAALRIAARMPDDSLESPVRLIALYLPQFHPIPENDKWWGEGFTEWDNVSKTKPLFPGHHQPHVPADLGYYDLREEETRVVQAELARKYGIEGFCYYHYWFNGHRLLERPVQDMLKSGKPDFPFCLCWANENWTRRWDGKDREILIQQKYSEEDDREHIRALIPVFKDKRYIRVNGKPLFLVYRTSDMPNPVRTAEIWREEACEAGLGDLYLCRVESIDKLDPAQIGFDSSMEFAPEWWSKGPQLDANSELLETAGPDIREVCKNNYVHSYKAMLESMMLKLTPSYKRFRCVTPAWDNWARRKKGATIFVGSTPELYRAWLSRVITKTFATFEGEERIVFVNAWNEWAEGCHLEPDEKYGHAYLEATRQAIEESELMLDPYRAGGSDAVKVGRLINQMINQEYHLEALEKVLKQQITQRDQKIEEILNSTSWRISAPVRWLKSLLLRLKGSPRD